jgi:membrane protease subunit HflK
MREIIGRTPIKNVLTEGRQSIQVQARQQLQDLLNEYGVGVRVRDVQLLAVDPPADVIDAFNEVQRARQDRDRLKNEAESFSNDIVPRARVQRRNWLPKPKPIRPRWSTAQQVMHRDLTKSIRHTFKTKL